MEIGCGTGLFWQHCLLAPGGKGSFPSVVGEGGDAHGAYRNSRGGPQRTYHREGLADHLTTVHFVCSSLVSVSTRSTHCFSTTTLCGNTFDGSRTAACAWPSTAMRG